MKQRVSFYVELACSYFFAAVGILLGAGVTLIGLVGVHFVGLDAADPWGIALGVFVISLGIASFVHGLKLKRKPSRQLW